MTNLKFGYNIFNVLPKRRKYMSKAKIKATDLIADILEKREDAAEILTSFGFHCLFCPSAQMETLEEACMVHGIEVKEVLAALNK